MVTASHKSSQLKNITIRASFPPSSAVFCALHLCSRRQPGRESRLLPSTEGGGWVLPEKLRCNDKQKRHVLQHMCAYLSITRNEIYSSSCYWCVHRVFSVLTWSLEEKAHAEERISLCQHILNPLCVYGHTWITGLGSKEKNTSQWHSTKCPQIETEIDRSRVHDGKNTFTTSEWSSALNVPWCTDVGVADRQTIS